MIGSKAVLGLGVAAAALLTATAPAAAAEIVTWKGKRVAESRFVDPAAAPPGAYNEPPGVEERPNALKVNVYLPDGYRKRGRRYPVLYLLHGVGDAYDVWAHPERGDVLDTAAGFPGVIVMPEADRGLHANWWNDGLRGDPAWERYHLDQLIPLVHERLRIRRKRRWHALAGISMGGLGAMFYASQRPGYFGSAASSSGMLSIQRPTFQLGSRQALEVDLTDVYGDPVAQDFYWRGHNATELVENLRHTRLYVAAGNGVFTGRDEINPDNLDSKLGQAVAEAELGMHAEEFVTAARAAGASVTYRPHDGVHDWPYWREDLADALEWGMFRRPPPAGRQWTYETVAAKGEMWGLRFRFDPPPEELITFRRRGRRLIGEGSGRVRLRTGAGCRLRATLPFERKLPTARRCRR